MICKKTCTLAAAFLGASLATSYFVDKTESFQRFQRFPSQRKETHLSKKSQKNAKIFILQD